MNFLAPMRPIYISVAAPALFLHSLLCIHLVIVDDEKAFVNLK